MGNCGRKQKEEAPNTGAGGGDPKKSDPKKSYDSGRNESRNHHDHEDHSVNVNLGKTTTTTTKAKSVKKVRIDKKSRAKKQSVEADQTGQQRTSDMSRYTFTSGYMKRASEKAEKERFDHVDELKSGLDKRGKALEQIDADAEALNVESQDFYNKTTLLMAKQEDRRGSGTSKKTISSFFSRSKH